MGKQQEERVPYEQFNALHRCQVCVHDWIRFCEWTRNGGFIGCKSPELSSPRELRRFKQAVREAAEAIERRAATDPLYEAERATWAAEPLGAWDSVLESSESRALRVGTALRARARKAIHDARESLGKGRVRWIMSDAGLVRDVRDTLDNLELALQCRHVPNKRRIACCLYAPPDKQLEQCWVANHVVLVRVFKAWETRKESGAGAKKHLADSLVAYVKALMEKARRNGTEPPSVADMAWQTGVSQRHLRRVLNRVDSEFQAELQRQEFAQKKVEAYHGGVPVAPDAPEPVEGRPFPSKHLAQFLEKAKKRGLTFWPSDGPEGYRVALPQ